MQFVGLWVHLMDGCTHQAGRCLRSGPPCMAAWVTERVKERKRERDKHWTLEERKRGRRFFFIAQCEIWNCRRLMREGGGAWNCSSYVYAAWGNSISRGDKARIEKEKKGVLEIPRMVSAHSSIVYRFKWNSRGANYVPMVYPYVIAPDFVLWLKFLSLFF